MSESLANVPMSNLDVVIEVVSDRACLLTFAETISEDTADRIYAATLSLRCIDGVTDLIPSYTTLLVCFDQQKFDRFTIEGVIKQTLSDALAHQQGRLLGREVVIPVYYDAEVGPDLQDVATHCGISCDEVIRLHSESTYRAYAIGFSLGFAFLGNTVKALHIGRKSTPRLKVPVGSVAIAEQQTAVYPSATPGGWQIIGRTPKPLIDWQSDSLALIQVGDRVRFEAISRAEFLAQGGQLDGF